MLPAGRYSRRGLSPPVDRVLPAGLRGSRPRRWGTAVVAVTVPGVLALRDASASARRLCGRGGRRGGGRRGGRRGRGSGSGGGRRGGSLGGRRGGHGGGRRHRMGGGHLLVHGLVLGPMLIVVLHGPLVGLYVLGHGGSPVGGGMAGRGR